MDGAHVLLDLEELGALALQGSTDVRAVLAALLVELATSPWPQDLQLTLVDACPDLVAALGNDRLVVTDDLDGLLDELEVWTSGVRSALADVGADGPVVARSTNIVPDSWIPHVVLLGREPSTPQRERLRSLITAEPQAPLAVVTTGASPLTESILTYRDDQSLATLTPFGLTLHPQVLPAAVYEQVLDMLRTADAAPDAPGPPWAVDLDTREPVVQDLRRHAEADAVRPVPARDADVERSRVQGTPAADGSHLELSPSTPMVCVLGSVEIVGARGVLMAESHRGRLEELLAFLALHPHRGHYLLDEAMWPGDRVPDGRRNQLLSRARAWLGEADGGRSFIPPANSEGYRLIDSVRTDWDAFCDRVGGSAAQAPTSDLTAALAMVRGQPFAGTSPSRYGWADDDRAEMISSIVDIAHEVSVRAQRCGDAALARRAAATGLKAEHGSELLWRDALRAEWLAGTRPGMERMADRIWALYEDLGRDLEPETIDLMNELMPRKSERQRRTSSREGGTTDGH